MSNSCVFRFSSHKLLSSNLKHEATYLGSGNKNLQLYAFNWLSFKCKSSHFIKFPWLPRWHFPWRPWKIVVLIAKIRDSSSVHEQTKTNKMHFYDYFTFCSQIRDMKANFFALAFVVKKKKKGLQIRILQKNIVLKTQAPTTENKVDLYHF